MMEKSQTINTFSGELAGREGAVLNRIYPTFSLPRLTLFLLALTVVGTTSQVYAGKPNTIPALQEWTDGTGSYTFGSASRIVLDQASATQLAATGQVFQSDLLALTGVSLPVVSGTQASLNGGDIWLSFGPSDSTLGTEGYNLSITDRIVISAPTDAGVFYGTRTVLQLIKQGTTFPSGVARDYPRYPLRALHVDNGRKFVTTDWLMNHIKELAYLKMNLFHWHLAEWNNFRFESSTHPEVVAAQHYTKAEVQQMMTLAASYHVTIMPEFEMPGHMGWALANHPELRVIDNTGYVNPDNIDLTQQAAYTLVSDLLNEWLPLIAGPYFHIGTDEYITDYTKFPQYTAYAQKNYGPTANAKDVYFHFINWVDGIIRSYGKTTWVWDDSKTGGSMYSLNQDVFLDSWTFAAQTEINQGFSLINSAQASLYYVWYTDWQPMQTQLYEQWAPNQWTYGSPGSLAPFAKGLFGAKLALWFDNNQCEEYSMAWGMHYSMRTIAQQTWASPKIAPTYVAFKAISDQLGRAPGTTFPTTMPPIANPNGPYTSAFGTPITFSSAGTSARNGTLAGYRWDFGDGGTSTQANPVYTYKAQGTFTASLIVTDSNGMTAGNQASVKIGTQTSPVTVTLSPKVVTLAPGTTQVFTAVVAGTSNTGVTWSASGGAIGSNGVYTAPSTAGNYTVQATSIADTTQVATAGVTVSVSPPPPVNGTNLALGKPTTASSQFSATYAPSMATDADPINTRWCARSAGNGQWLMVDLGTSMTLTGTEVKWESNGVWGYKVEVSPNGIQWALVVDKTTNTAPAQLYNDTFSATGRYIRITSTSTESGHWASIYDFEVFGKTQFQIIP